jgi:hypothetical protein
VTDEDFDRIYEESGCNGDRDKIIAFLIEKRRALTTALHAIEASAGEHFHKLHGTKMCGPRNETERVLLDISTACADALNEHGEPNLPMSHPAHEQTNQELAPPHEDHH